MYFFYSLFGQHHSTAKCGMHKSIKLNYFEHGTLLRVVKKLVLVIDLVSSSLIWCVFLKVKLKCFFCKHISEDPYAYTLK